MKKRIVIIVVIVVVAGLGIRAWRQAEARAGGEVMISGNIEVTDVQVSFKVPGRVQQRAVSEGDRVQAGAVVAVLDTTELAQAAAQAEAAAAVAKAEALRMKLEFSRQEDLYDKKVISSREYEMAQTLKTVADARVKEAEAAQTIAKTRLEEGTLRAPITGTVLSEHVEPGEYVVPGTPVVTVGDLGNTWLRGYITESDLGRVKLGQDASITTDSYPGKRYHGKVSFIASDAEFTPRQVQTRKERVKLVYRIKVDIPNANAELKPGMPADADIVVK